MFRRLVLAVAAPLLLVACATEADRSDLSAHLAPDAEASPIAALRSAPDLATEAGSARFEMSFTFDVPEAPMELLATGAYSGDQMSMEMDLGSMLSALAAGTDEEVPAGFDEPMQVVLDGDTVYVRMPMLDLLTGTSGWLSATPEDLGQTSGAFGITGTATSPTQLLETLRGVADDVEEVGRDEVRGVDTTHYRATIDFDAVLDAIPAEQRAEMEAQLDQLDGAGVGTVPLDVWIGDDGLPRRMEMAFDDLGASLGVPGSATMAMELFDYGEAVEIDVPPASEVTPFTEVMPGVGGALG